MNTPQIKKSLKNLGKLFYEIATEVNNNKENTLYFNALNTLIKQIPEKNPWFTRENILTAFKFWNEALQDDKVEKWIDSYPLDRNFIPKTVGLVTAGNIPMVGLHDMLSVLVSGHKAKIKMSSKDNLLLPLIYKFLADQNPGWKNKVTFTDEPLGRFDAVIATGSDNTARYFEYYFGKYPHIIRKNRNGVAVLTGTETEAELEALADDIMLYYGMGCRNVSKIFVPVDYDLNNIFKATLKYARYADHQKYMNNYRYNKAVFVMSTDEKERNDLLENGLILLKKDHRYASPIGVIFYETYDNLDDVKSILQHDKDKIQVIVSKADIPGAIPFGTTQKPELWDYADGIDTLEFLLKLN
jgi:hypothetical protein